MAASITTFGGRSYAVVDPARVAAFVRSPVGPIFRHMIIRGEKVKLEAIRLAPVGKPNPNPFQTPDHEPGNLRNHIVKRVAQDKRGIVVLVGVENVPYAIWVHEGSQPHAIYPRNATRLVFFSQRAGQVIFMPVGMPVHHPGNAPNRFLIRALRAAA